MSTADPRFYLGEITEILRRPFPENKTINIVCHGHSVPAGHFDTPMVDSMNAYPHLLHAALKQRFPFAVINVIVTAIGAEHSESGAARFVRDVLCHRPDVITIDYGLNDRRIGLEQAQAAWSSMVRLSLEADVKTILLTPTLDVTQGPDYEGEDRSALMDHANQIRDLAEERSVGMADSFTAQSRYVETGVLSDILSRRNHPNRRGHDLVVRELMRWFPMG